MQEKPRDEHPRKGTQDCGSEKKVDRVNLHFPNWAFIQDYVDCGVWQLFYKVIGVLIVVLLLVLKWQAHYSTGKVSTSFTSTIIVPQTSNEAGL